MVQRGVSYQEHILNTLRKEKAPVTVYLVNGVPVKGIVRGFDNFVVIIEGDGKQMMIYKHAISTLTPAQSLPLSGMDEAENGE